MVYSPYLAANRFGLGASVRDMTFIEFDPRRWVLNQLKANASLPDKYEDSASITKRLLHLKDMDASGKNVLIKEGLKVYRDELAARFSHAVSTENPVLERLVNFWSNHFTVSLKGKPQIAALVGAFEREAIRPHILGKFSDMLLASTQHPAMLIYLDNAQSIGPNSFVGKRRNKGLNENLAREILELHTLGVNGGYTQDDVIALAKIITGWSITPPKQGGGGFEYIRAMHEIGTQKLLGKNYPQTNMAQGIAALKDLATHPSTARFIATKLARHFIDDNPPDICIRRLENAFLKTGGDLKAVMETLIYMEESWALPAQKVKKPYDLMVSSFRLAEADPELIPPRKIFQSLGLFEHVPFGAPSPAGWPDTEKDWLSPNAVMNRVEWCYAFAQALQPKDQPLRVAQTVLADTANPETLMWIERAPSATEGFALLLASPEWQRR